MNKRYNFIISIALLLGFHCISLAQEINCEELYDLNITSNPELTFVKYHYQTAPSWV